MVKRDIYYFFSLVRHLLCVVMDMYMKRLVYTYSYSKS